MHTPRFLGVDEREGPCVVLASYPRSGNSLLRKILEEITGVITGSDTRPGDIAYSRLGLIACQDRTLGKSLKDFGMEGEGVTDDSVQVAA